MKARTLPELSLRQRKNQNIKTQPPDTGSNSSKVTGKEGGVTTREVKPTGKRCCEREASSDKSHEQPIAGKIIDGPYTELLHMNVAGSGNI